MRETNGKIRLYGRVLTLMLSLPAFGQETLETVQQDNGNVQRIRLVEDDAQNYMVSKIYELEHQMANDIVPFVLGAIKRYANNGTADRINYKAGGKQLVAVTCPVPLVPYIDDMIAKLDHPSPKDRNGSGVEGTGIIRSVYIPQYRSGKTMMDVMVKAGISSNAAEGANQDAAVAFDPATNRIYWKDSVNKDKDMHKYLAWLDRPVPQFTLSLNIYEVRESDLLDLGIDYLAWKNGPGMNLLNAGGAYLESKSLEATSGPYGYFLFAPSFDFSFLRILQQNGKARVTSSAKLTVSSGHDAALSFTPDYQNLAKDENLAGLITGSANDHFELKVLEPVISLSGAADADGRLGFSEEDYAQQIGILSFVYELAMKQVVERDNLGNELYDENQCDSSVTIQTGCERMLSRWTREMEVEQTIGIPFLCEIPVLKYIFGTTTRTKEKFFCFLSARVELLHPDTDIADISGNLTSVAELVNNNR